MAIRWQRGLSIAAQYKAQRPYSWIISLWASLLLTLTPCLGAWSQEKDVPSGAQRQLRTTTPLHVAVTQGKLSVDLQEADIGEVLAQIGRQGDISMSFRPPSHQRVSAHFSDVDLDKGLRRLLRLAGLNYTILYAQEPSGKTAIREVRIFGAAQGGTLQQAASAQRESMERQPEPTTLDLEPTRPVPEPTTPINEVLTQISEMIHLTEESAGDQSADGSQEASEAPDAEASNPGQVKQNETSRHFLKAFGLGSD